MGLFKHAMKLAYGTPVPSKEDVDGFHQLVEWESGGVNPWHVVGGVVAIAGIGALIYFSGGTATPAVAVLAAA